MERLQATYLVEISLDVTAAAETLAGEQSCGTFVLVSGDTESLRHMNPTPFDDEVCSTFDCDPEVDSMGCAIEFLEVEFPFAPGAPRCTIHAPDSPADSRQVNFKGGQVGRPDYFGCLLQGST